MTPFPLSYLREIATLIQNHKYNWRQLSQVLFENRISNVALRNWYTRVVALANRLRMLYHSSILDGRCSDGAGSGSDSDSDSDVGSIYSFAEEDELELQHCTWQQFQQFRAGRCMGKHSEIYAVNMFLRHRLLHQLIEAWSPLRRIPSFEN
uniref:Uncharacterized protein n=2 Tax=Lygus hesperus TaxID=30085 RepID=A0A146MA36_LYGHE